MFDEKEDDIPVELQDEPMAWKWGKFRKRMLRQIHLDEQNTRLRLWGYFPLAGASLVVFSLVRMLYLLIPLKLTNPAWELQVLASGGELAATMFFGAALFFFIAPGDIRLWKLSCFHYASWACLFVGVICILLIPLAVFDAQRVMNNLNLGYTQAWNQREEEWVRFRDSVKSAQSTQEEASLANALGLRQQYIEHVSQDLPLPNERKQWLITEARKQFDGGQHKAAGVNHFEKWKLVKLAFRTVISLAFSGFFFILLWFMTRWIRIIYRNERYFPPDDERYPAHPEVRQ